MHACPAAGALELRLEGCGDKVSPWWIPTAVLVLALFGIGSASLVAVPSYTRDFQPAAAARRGQRTTVLLVEGLRCVDTAERAAVQLEGAPGIIRFEAFASRNRAEVTYATRTDPAAIIQAIESPVYNEETGEVAFGVYRVVEVDGIPPGSDSGDRQVIETHKPYMWRIADMMKLTRLMVLCRSGRRSRRRPAGCRHDGRPPPSRRSPRKPPCSRCPVWTRWPR